MKRKKQDAPSQAAVALDDPLRVMRRLQDSVYYQRPLKKEKDDEEGLVTFLKTSAKSMMDIFQLCRLQHPDTIVNAVSYLDRYLSVGKREDSLMALVCFYVAVKIHEPASLPIKSLPDLYERFFCSTTTTTTCIPSISDVERGELELLQVLQWHVYPPTAISICRQYQASTTKDDDAIALLERALYQDPIAYVRHYRPWTLAMAALYLTAASAPHEPDKEEEYDCCGYYYNGHTDCDPEQQEEVGDDCQELGHAMCFLGGYAMPELEPEQQETVAEPRRKRQKRNDSSSSSFVSDYYSPRSALAVTCSENDEATTATTATTTGTSLS